MNKDFSKRILREFGLLLGLAFPFLIGWILPSLGGHPFKIWTLWVSVPSLILAILKPRFLLLPYKAWMIFGNILGWINSHIVLGFVFFIVLQPIALVMKIFGHDPLRMKKKIGENSYREIKNSQKINLKKIF